MTNRRRLLSAFVASLSLHQPVMPAIAIAMETPLEEYRVAPGSWTLETFSRAGGRNLTIADADWARRLMTVDRDLRAVDAAQIDSIRFDLQNGLDTEIGQRVIPALLTVYDALQAPTPAAYFEFIRKLPVQVRISNGLSAEGRPGTSKEFWVDGRPRAKTFRVHSETPTTVARVRGPFVDSDDFGGVHAITNTPTCTYTDPNEVFWSGECATVAEVDAAIATMLALESSVDNTQAEVASTKADYCGAPPGSYDSYCYDTEFQAHGGPALDCVAEGFWAASAVLGYVGSLLYLEAAVTAPLPVATAVIASGTVALGAAAAVVAAGIGVIRCMQQT